MTDLERLGRHVGEVRKMEPRRPADVGRLFAEFRAAQFLATRCRRPTEFDEWSRSMRAYCEANGMLWLTSEEKP